MSRRAPRSCRPVCRSRIRSSPPARRRGRWRRGLVLPGVVGGRDLHAHRPDREMLADVVTVRRQALLFHQRSHVLRRVILTGHPGKITTGRDAVVVVVAVRDQQGVQIRDVGGGDWKLNHHRHVETAQKGIDHHRRAATVDQEPAMPSHRRTVPSLASKASAPNGCV